MVSADKYHHVCRHEGNCTDVLLIAWHDGSADPENKACLEQIVYLNQMGHFIIPQQLAVNVVSGFYVSPHLILP